MTDPSGSALDAAAERRAALEARYQTSVQADTALASTLRAAHEAARAARARLETLTAEVERYRENVRGGTGPDNGMTARELQRSVISGNREAADIIAEVRRDAAAKAAVLRTLHAQYHQR